MPLPPCARDNDAASRWHLMHGNPPAPNVEYPAAEVDLVSTGATVDYQSSLRFHFDKDNQAGWTDRAPASRLRRVHRLRRDGHEASPICHAGVIATRGIDLIQAWQANRRPLDCASRGIIS